MKTLLALILFASTAAAQAPDPALLIAIRGIKAIDNHSHPPALVAAGQKDDDFDALPCDPLEPTNPSISAALKIRGSWPRGKRCSATSTMTRTQRTCTSCSPRNSG